MEYIFDSGWIGSGPMVVFDYATNPPGQFLGLVASSPEAVAAAAAATGSPARRVATSTRFKPFGPRVHLDVPPEDNWPAPPPPPPAPNTTPRPRVARRAAPALPARAMPPLLRPQVAPAPPPQPSLAQAANAFLATLTELAVAAGLEQDAIATLQRVDAIDVSDVFNDMR